MMNSLLHTSQRAQQTVAVIGAGTMGAGIAQVAAAAGHPVLLMDARAGAAAEAKAKISAALDSLVQKERMGEPDRDALLARIRPVERLADLKEAVLVIEAIVEQLQAKQALLRELENHVSSAAILATNTSSISVTAIANGLAHPQRLVGMHFFNPVPLMKLVEVVSGAETSPALADCIHALSRAWGKTPVHAKSTPGFIVNRIARPYYAEALALLQEQALTPAGLDRLLRSVGFRMGPCELMDLIGHDINYAVTQSVFDANYGDRRYLPSLVQKALIDGGRLGRKVGKGFFDGAPAQPAPAARRPLQLPVVVAGEHGLADRLAAHLALAEVAFSRDRSAGWTGLQVGTMEMHVSDGRTANELAALRHKRRLAVIDLPLFANADPVLALAFAEPVEPEVREEIMAALAACKLQPLEMRDVPGLVVARTITMLVNEAADAVYQGVCDAAGADQAMKLGVNYPAGPFEWLDSVGVDHLVRLLDRLADYYRGERYRVSPLLRQRYWAARIPD